MTKTLGRVTDASRYGSRYREGYRGRHTKTITHRRAPWWYRALCHLELAALLLSPAKGSA